MCKLLRDIKLRNCGVGDDGALMLAERCARLVRLDLSHCNITDIAIVALATKCSKLEDVDLSFCANLTDISMNAVLENCKYLTRVNFSGTLVRTITKYVVCPLQLTELSVDSCPGLTDPPDDVTSRGLDNILRHYKDFCLAYRLKVFLFGSRNAGKTSLLDNLLMSCDSSPATKTERPTQLHGNQCSGSMASVDDSLERNRNQETGVGYVDDEPDVAMAALGPTEGVDVRVWYPFRQNPRNESFVKEYIYPAQRNLRLEFWDLSGREICRKAHPIYMTSQALYMVIFDISDVTRACDEVISHISTIQAKVPGFMAMLVATHCDKLTEEELNENTRVVMSKLLDHEKRNTAILKSELILLKNGPVDSTVYNKFEELEYSLYKRPRLVGDVCGISNTTLQGYDLLKKVLLRRALSIETFPHLAHYAGPNVLQAVQELREAAVNTCLLPWRDYKDVIIRDGRLCGDNVLETESYFLHATGVVLDLNVHSHDNDLYNHFTALRPAEVADCICKILVDEKTRAYRFDSRRFWPRDVKPKPTYLAKIIEDIPTHGLLRETLLPLLWQSVVMNDSQVGIVLHLLKRLGLLVPWASADEGEDDVATRMPDYPNLSSARQYYVSLLGTLPESRPQLNWTTRPFPGDLQITWRYEFPTSYPAGLMERLLSVCIYITTQHTYQHVWRSGMLIKIGEALICVQYTDKYFEIACRMNADEDDNVKKTTEGLWLHLSYYVYSVDKTMRDWRGLATKEYLIPTGRQFYKDEIIEDDVEFEVSDCFARLRLNKQKIFYDRDRERELDIEILFPPLGENISVMKWLKNMFPRRDAMIRQSQGPEAMNNWIPKIQLPSPTESQTGLSMDNGQNLVEKAAKTRKVEIRWKMDGCDGGDDEDSGDDNVKTSTDNHENHSNHANKHVDVAEVSHDENSVKIASSFVASILAQSVAHYITDEYEITGHDSKSPEVQAAVITAQAAAAAESGDVDGAANAVIASHNNVRNVTHKTENVVTHNNVGDVASSEPQKGTYKTIRTIRSKMCLII